MQSTEQTRLWDQYEVDVDLLPLDVHSWKEIIQRLNLDCSLYHCFFSIYSIKRCLDFSPSIFFASSQSIQYSTPVDKPFSCRSSKPNGLCVSNHNEIFVRSWLSRSIRLLESPICCLLVHSCNLVKPLVHCVNSSNHASTSSCNVASTLQRSPQHLLYCKDHPRGLR